MVEDHAKTNHGRDSTRVTVTKRILASCEGTSGTGHYWVCLVVGFSSVFLPFINRGKRFFDAESSKVVLPSYLPILRPTMLSPQTNSSHSLMVNQIPPTIRHPSFRYWYFRVFTVCRLLRNLSYLLWVSMPLTLYWR